MSSLATNAITDAAGGNTATINSYTPTESNMAGRNRIINGDMRIDQRNAGASVTPANGDFTLDRFQYISTQASKASIQQSTISDVGFNNSLLFTSLSAYSIGAGDYFGVRHMIEGLNVSDLGWGTANAQTVTLSFRVRSSLTGTFGGSITNGDGTRSYPFSYTINSADTFETKSITIEGDTTGTWLKTNGRGVIIYLMCGTGSTYSGTAGAWSGSWFLSTTGATSVVGTSGATFYITGVQLEAGSVATPFERRQYGQELALCQRYYERFDGEGWSGNYAGMANGTSFGTSGLLIINMKTEKRTAPTFSSGGSFRMLGNGGTSSFSFLSDIYISKKGNGYVNAGSISPSIPAGQSLTVTANNDANAFLAFSSEL